MSEYRKQRLLFFVAQDINGGLRMSVKEFVERMANERGWVISPPRFIDALDDSRTREGDMPDETIGGELLIFACEDGLPKEIDEKIFDDVNFLISSVRDISKDKSISFEFELDGSFVGAIDDGELDRSLSEGLLGEWRRNLKYN